MGVLVSVESIKFKDGTQQGEWETVFNLELDPNDVDTFPRVEALVRTMVSSVLALEGTEIPVITRVTLMRAPTPKPPTPPSPTQRRTGKS